MDWTRQSPLSAEKAENLSVGLGGRLTGPQLTTDGNQQLWHDLDLDGGDVSKAQGQAASHTIARRNAAHRWRWRSGGCYFRGGALSNEDLAVHRKFKKALDKYWNDLV